ncbi:MAG: amidohydrolase, partial [Pirellulaceae bacterium]
MDRRSFLAISTLAALSPRRAAAAWETPERIIDTHQHLWDLQRIRLPWLEGAPDTLRHRFDLEEYREATKGLPIEAIYM